MENGNVSLYFTKPCKSMEFVHGDSGQLITVPGKTFSKLLQALEDIGPAAQLVAEMCAEVAVGTREELKDDVFFSRTVDTTSRKNQIRLEGSIYRNKMYVFLKRFYYDKEFEVWKPSKGCLKLTLNEDFPVVKKLLLEGGARLVQRKGATNEEQQAFGTVTVESFSQPMAVGEVCLDAAVEQAAAAEESPV